MNRMSIPGNACIHCKTIITTSLRCSGCGWVDPVTTSPSVDSRRISLTDFEDEAAWYCNHCGLYFPAEDLKCPCGAEVNEFQGYAEMKDGHRWTPPGAETCSLCRTFEYQGTVTCTQDPCSYCRRPKQTYVVVHPKGPFSTERDALDHAFGMSKNVYGSSVHKTGVQRRSVTPWETI